MASEPCVGNARGRLLILDIEDPGNVTALDRRMIWRLNGSGKDPKWIGSNELVESRKMQVCMDWSEIHDLKAPD